MALIDLKPGIRRRSVRALAPILICLLGLLFSASASGADSTALGWGENGTGQVGSGTVSVGGCACIQAPTPLPGLSGLTQIAGAESHTLGLLANGTVMAWGSNNDGQLGDGTTENSATPVAAQGLANVVEVAAGGHASLALLANGTVMAWGENSSGQLGSGGVTGPETCGTNACSKHPVAVPVLTDVVAIAAGSDFAVALLGDGTVRVWGEDIFGQTGDGTGAQSGCLCVTQPTVVPGVSGAMAISAGLHWVSALLRDGTVEDWGGNFDGELGNGTVTAGTPCLCLGPVAASGVSGAKAIAAGGFHGTATLASGSVKAWGFNGFGQLGNGTFTESPTGCSCIPAPALVSGLMEPLAIAGGGEHSIALLANGGVEAWGRDVKGQLGVGAVDLNLPTAVGGISGASGVSTGPNTSFALIGPSQSLKVSLEGAGSGTVGGPTGILCPSACEGHYPQSQVEILRAEPSPGSGFAGFSGPCTGTAPCQVKLGQDQSLTATFGPPKGTKITKAKIVSKRKTASFSFSAPGAITGFQCKLIKPTPHRKGQRKPKKPRFSRCATSKLYKHLKPGRYRFQVRALDILGADVNPATRSFTIKARKRVRR
jgi:alpha-tubulin suppressor-like RCC1 family protein